MGYHKHKLNSQTHSHIIGRQDSITGDTVEANDEVVFCKSCESVFLVESWEYMEKKHCKQRRTLSFIPMPTPTLVVKKRVIFKKKIEKLVFEFSDSRVENLLSLLPTLMISASLLLRIQSRYWILYILLLTFGSGFIGIVGLKLLEDKKLRSMLKMDTKSVRVLETGLQLQNSVFYPFEEIKKIDYVKEKKSKTDSKFGFTNFKTYLRIYLQDGEIIKQKVISKNYINNKQFIFAVSWIRKFTEFHLYTEDFKDEEIINQLERIYRDTNLALDS